MFVYYRKMKIYIYILPIGTCAEANGNWGEDLGTLGLVFISFSSNLTIQLQQWDLAVINPYWKWNKIVSHMEDNISVLALIFTWDCWKECKGKFWWNN